MYACHKENAIQSRSEHIMAKKRIYKRWSKEDIKILKKYFPHMSTQKMAESLGRATDSVGSKANELGLKKTEKYHREERNLWSQSDIKLLMKLYPKSSNQEIAEKVGRTIKSVITKASNLRLHKENLWSPEKIKFLKKHYPTMNTQRIAKELNHTSQAVLMMASRLGLHKTKK